MASSWGSSASSDGRSALQLRAVPSSKPASRDPPLLRYVTVSERARGVPPDARQRSSRLLSFGELEALAGSLLPVFLTFLDSGVPREESRLFQLTPELRVVIQQRARDAVSHGARLPRHAASADVHPDGEPLAGLRDGQGGSHDGAQNGAGEVRVDVALVDLDLALPRTQQHARDGVLPLAGAVVLDGRCQAAYLLPGCAAAARSPMTGTSRGSGFCAAWGCSEPPYTFSFVISFLPSEFFGSIPATASSMTLSGRVSRSLPAEISLSPPGYPVWRRYILSCFFLPVSTTRDALTTTT